MRPYPDIIGKRFGKLTVLERVGTHRTSHRHTESLWKCRCECGGERITPAGPLKQGRTTSCGCNRYNKPSRKRHGHAGYSLRKIPASPTYKVWRAMVVRCTKPYAQGYDHYGKAGIGVCNEWMRFDNFLADMGERPSTLHSLDRIDSAGNYEPKNCRWATAIEQATNRKNVRRLEYKGETYSLASLSRLANCSEETLRARLKNGWSVIKAVETSVRPKRPNGSANKPGS